MSSYYNAISYTMQAFVFTNINDKQFDNYIYTIDWDFGYNHINIYIKIINIMESLEHTTNASKHLTGIFGKDILVY